MNEAGPVRSSLFLCAVSRAIIKPLRMRVRRGSLLSINFVLSIRSFLEAPRALVSNAPHVRQTVTAPMTNWRIVIEPHRLSLYPLS
jgi:hypothetical protein